MTRLQLLLLLLIWHLLRSLACAAQRYLLQPTCCADCRKMMLQWMCALLQVELSELTAVLRLGDCLTLG